MITRFELAERLKAHVATDPAMLRRDYNLACRIVSWLVPFILDIIRVEVAVAIKSPKN